MGDKHISSQFDAELNSISTHVLEMGGLVESQLHQAVYALIHLSLETAEQVLETEHRINQKNLESILFLLGISEREANLLGGGDMHT